MIAKGELQKVELANDLLVVLETVSTQDRIDILQLALDLMQDEKDIIARNRRTWIIHSKTQVGISYLVTLADDVFSCTCPDFQFRAKQCKHIRNVKRIIAGEKQKNKLPGVG
jgi:uncharacterized Zn finger protein